MSKPSSGHFCGTTGSKAVQNYLSQIQANSAIIVKKGFDKREHPTKYRQLSSSKQKVLREKVNNRTITKGEYKRLRWQKRLNDRRKAGIDIFWDQEKYRIANNLPTTRNWSAKQRRDILNNKRPKHNGISMQSHHTYSVSKYPHLANKGELIYPVTKQEHYVRWHGKNYKKSLPGKPVNSKMKEEL